MKTVASLADATRLAARSGGSLSVGGRLINAGGERFDVGSLPAPPAPPPPVTQSAGVTPGDLQAALASRDEIWQAHAAGLQRQVDLLAAMVSSPRRAPTWRITKTVDSEGQITELLAEPQYPT